jgi:hypothetical protein
MAKGDCDTLNPSPQHSGWWFTYDNRLNRAGFNYTCFGNLSGGYNGGGNSMYSSQIYLNVNTWYMFTLVVKDNQARVFVNGVQIGPTKNLVNLQLNDLLNRNMCIACNVDARIDDVRFYNRALSDQEIKAIYEATR